jgi:hypothetical protein
MAASFETVCCGQPMVALGQVDFLDMNVNSIQRWLCPECGRCLDLVDYWLDQEELENQLESYAPAEPTIAHHAHGCVHPGDEQLKGGGKHDGLPTETREQ